MSKKENKLYAVYHLKCPRCHEGDIFKGGFSYRFKQITEMHEKCPNCKLKYEREPGFFYGAMYVSYALTVALWVSVAVVSFVFFQNFNPWIFMISGIVLLLILLPGIYRLSRAVWLTMFVSYEPEKKKNKLE